MMQTLLPLTFLALLMAGAPAALAQDGETTPPSEPRDGGDAWVKDCPPDMMCAYAGGEGEPKAPDCDSAADGTCDDGRVYKGEDRPTYDGNCGAEVCAYGGEDCIECSGPVDDGSTCMDGQQEGETCRDDVQYMTPPEDQPSRGPADGSCEYCRGGTGDGDAPVTDAEPISAPVDGAPPAVDAGAETASDDARNTVPGGALLGTLAALGLVGFALRRRG